MGTQGTAISATDPRLTEEIQHLYTPPPLKSKFAITVAALGLPDHAERLDYCGRFQKLRDKNGHTTEKHQHCMSSYCKGCAYRNAIKTQKRWKGALNLIETLPFDYSSSQLRALTYIEITMQQPSRSAEAMDAMFEMVDKVTQAGIAKNCGIPYCNGPRWMVCPGYKGNLLTIRILIPNVELGTETWVAMFPANASVRAESDSVRALSEVFLRNLLRVDIPDDPVDRAEQEVLFFNKHRFRARASIRDFVPTQLKLREGEIDLFASTSLIANKSNSTLLNTVIHGTVGVGINPEICQICGEKYTEQSQWFPVDHAAPAAHEIEWYPRC